MSEFATEITFVVLAYLLGAVPFAFVLGRALGIDLRRVGSGNMGAGNLTRTAGMGPGIAGAVLDGLKGLAPFLLASWANVGAATASMAGIAAVAGHNWSIYFKGRGGRGLATSVGVVVGVHPLLIVWPGVWSAVGWKIGGGLAGFVAWSLLPVVAAWAGLGAAAVSTCAALAVFMMVRRAQGNRGRVGGWQASLHRVVFDREPGDERTRTSEEPARP